MILEDLILRSNRPTTPDDPANLTTRLGRVSEIVKSMFVWELRHYFNRNSPDRIAVVPFIEKFSTELPGADRDNDPLETVVRIIRQYPDITERLPYVGVAVTAAQNEKMAVSTKYIGAVMPRPRLVAGGNGDVSLLPAIVPWSNPAESNTFTDNALPGVPANWPEPIGSTLYGLDDGDWLEITTVLDSTTHVSTFVFNRMLLGSAPQTPRTIADIINLQALYCHADVIFHNSVPTLVIEPGGPLGGNAKTMSIQRTGASANFDAFIRLTPTVQIAPSIAYPVANRSVNSLTMTVSLVIGTEGDTIRTELSDLLLNFFTLVLDDRQFTLWGRSFMSNIPDEFYQVIIQDKGVGLSGEQELPRPDDPARKVYINRLNVPIYMIQYIDRAVQQGATASNTDSLPGMN